MSKRLLVIGNPLLDISSEVDQAFLDKFALKAGAAGLATEQQMPIFKELAERKDVVYVPGGSALNSVRVANWQLKDAGAADQTSYIGAIGKDAFADIMTQKCAAEGVRFASFTLDDKPTGTCAVAILQKERALLANVAAAGAFPTEGLATAAALECIAKSDIMYTTGFFLLTNADAAVNVATAYKALGRTVAMNLSAEFIVSVCKGALERMYPLCDLIVCNEAEAEAWRGANADGEAKDVPAGDLKAIATALAKLGGGQVGGKPRTAIVTNGANPTISVVAGEAPVEHAVAPVAAESIVDLNGAGDAFVGGLLAGLSKGDSLSASIDRGNAAAGVIIKFSGCQWA